MIYVAALAPDAGESALTIISQVPPSPLSAELRVDAAGYVRLTASGMKHDFAHDLAEEVQAAMFAAQKPISLTALSDPVAVAAWRSKPSWYVLATKDRTLPTELQSIMSKRMGARVTATSSGHLVMLAHPVAIADVIVVAARATAAAGLGRR